MAWRSNFPMNWLLWTIFLSFVSSVNTQAFTATVKLQTLPKDEERLIFALKRYLETADLEDSEKKIYLENFLSKAEEANQNAKGDNSFVEKPTNAFLLIRRLAEGWEHVTQMICADANDESQQQIEFCHAHDAAVQLSASWPSREDLKGACQALIRLADFYKLNFHGLADGMVYGTKMTPLAVEDLTFIADVAVEDDQEYLGSIWYKNALKILSRKAPDDFATKTRLQRKLAGLYYKNSMYNKALKVLQEAERENPTHSGLQRDLKLYRTRRSAVTNEEPKRIPRPEFFIDPKIMATYRRLCKAGIKSPVEQSKLYCRYKRTKIPLIPSKLEYANVDPPVVLFHDILTEKETEHVKTLAKKYLTRSVVGDESVITPVRISQTAWFDELDDILLGMAKKVELHSGLSAMSTSENSHAEPWQVLNYGLGGLYVPHEDSVSLLREKGVSSEIGAMKNSGDRLATFLFYLTDVPAGGATVFPHLKARVPVVKGGAALWYNLHRNGTVDTRHLHAGCPVLIGSKWASNKWIREIGQAFRRPCGLDHNV